MIDYLIIGAQRCGTTSLYNYMITHPQIIPAKEKEIHYFDINFNKGLDWYLANFPTSHSVQKKNIMTGEASPYYIFHPLTAERIFKTIPNSKLLVLLRDPIERAFSHYYLIVKMGKEPLSFEDAIKSEKERLDAETAKVLSGEFSFNHQHYSYLARGIYVDQLIPYFELFPKENILILKSEDFFKNSQQTLNQVFDFLGLPNFDVNEFQKYNFGNNPPMNEDTRKFLVDYFKPHNERLYKFLKKSFGWH